MAENGSTGRTPVRIRVNPGRLDAGDPPIVVYDPQGRQYAAGVTISGPSRVVWNPDSDPPSVWVETEAPFTLE